MLYEFWIFDFPGLEELDLVEPWEMVLLWRRVAQGPERCFMVAEKPEPVICAKGMSINPHVTFTECPSLDYLLVPGGEGIRKEADSQALINFVSAQAQNCQAVLSICTSAFILHRAGLLAGRRATTHWSSLQKLRDLGDVNSLEQRIVQDSNIWTSAGVSAGIDLALAFIESVAGEKTAGKIQFGAEYYPSVKSHGGFHMIEQAP